MKLRPFLILLAAGLPGFLAPAAQGQPPAQGGAPQHGRRLRPRSLMSSEKR